MKLSTFQKAESIQKRIDSLSKAMACFEFEDGTSKNPTLVIEHLDEDYEGRTQSKLPISLSDELIEQIKTALTMEIIELNKEFDTL